MLKSGLVIFLLLAGSAHAVDHCGKHYRAIRALYDSRSKPYNDDRWPWDLGVAGRITYDESFAPLLGKKLTEWAKARKDAGRPTHMIDLFGSGVFMDDMTHVDSITGIRQVKKIVPGMKPGYPNEKWAELAGNIYARKTWNELDARMRDFPIPSFDLIISRPIGPAALRKPQLDNWFYRKAYLSAHFALIERAYARLSKNDGVMIVEIPYTVSQLPEFKKWIDQMKADGLDFTHQTENILGWKAISEEEKVDGSGALMIRRSATSPERLPRLQ